MKSGKSKKTTTKPKAKEENDEFFTEEEVKRLDKFHDEIAKHSEAFFCPAEERSEPYDDCRKKDDRACFLDE